MKKLKLGVNDKVSNKDYHGDKEYLSSSALKKILSNSEEFYKEYILGQRGYVQKNVFDEGSLVHAMILEPEVIEEEFAFFDGFIKRGKIFEEFKTNNPGKIWISKSQKLRCDKYVKAYERLESAVSLMRGGEPEHTLCSIISGVPVKVRPDYINIEKGYIVDVKTSGHSVDLEMFKETVGRYSYDLSAALYCEVAKEVYEKDFDFYFVAISKPEETCEVYKVSAKTYKKGRDAVFDALNKYRSCKKKDDWTESYKPAIIEPKGDYEILEV